MFPTSRILPAVLIALLSSVSAQAADLPATSTIDAVTVFPSSAEVTRLIKIRIPAGEHIVVLKDLPQSAVAPSIRVEGKASGPLAIGAVDSQRTFFSEAETAITAAERRQIELDIERLSDDKNQLAAEIEAAEARKKLLANLADLPTRPVPQPTTTSLQTDWAALVQLIGQQTVAAQKALLEASVKIRDVDRRIVDLQKKLAPIAPAQVQRTEVKIAVTATAPVEADLTVRYQVPNAGWTPFYDARLTTGTKTVQPKLSLVRRASIQQRTGEAWEAVALTLSTTRPAQGSQAPDLTPYLVDLIDPAQPRPAPMAMAPASVAGAVTADQGVRTRGVMAPPMAEAAQKVDARPIQATIDGNAFQAHYGIPGRHSVGTTGEGKRVQIDQAELEPALTVRTVPKRDAKAYLYAKLVTPRTTAILPGQVALFRDGTFVGNGRLPQLAAGEDHELGFGQDDNVRVRYAVTDEKRGETGIISTSRTEAKAFKISVKSLHERPLQVRVLDQYPVAQNQDIKVETTARVAPTGRDPDDKRGLIYWDFSLAPDEERVFDFGYRLTWPATKQLSGR